MRSLRGHGVRFVALSSATGATVRRISSSVRLLPGHGLVRSQLQQPCPRRCGTRRPRALRLTKKTARSPGRKRLFVRNAQRQRADRATFDVDVERGLHMHPSRSRPRRRARSRRSGDRRSRWSATTASPTSTWPTTTRSAPRARSASGTGRHLTGSHQGRPGHHPGAHPADNRLTSKSRASSIQWQQQCRAVAGTGQRPQAPIPTGC